MNNKCRLCNNDIPEDHFDRLCDRCWELEIRIEKNPEIAMNILVDMGYKIVPEGYKFIGEE
jgi:hypothetical protein